jgi:chromosomal replication initiator protein DnaA
MSFSPTQRGENRYKIRLWAEEKDLKGLMDKIGNICSRPFVPQDKEYNWAFYVYNVEPKLKEKIIKILDESMQAHRAAVSQKEALEEIQKKQANINQEEAEFKKSVVAVGELKLNPAYTFENFVVGSSNRFTHAATQAVAKSPGEIYNPLFIYGGVGLGKTHLLHAIGHYVHDKRPNAKILYVTTEKLMSEVIEAIGKGTLKEFRERYRQVDLLLIDDIQFLAESESAQEEFFHTFNVLHDAHKQIVITSDKPPKQLTTLEERLKSRFEWGLIADIKSPSLETRVAILKKKEEIEHLDLADNILVYIAGKLKSNIRELEGFLKRINAYSKLTKQEITIELVRELMNDLLPEREREEFVEVKPAEITVVPEVPSAKEEATEEEIKRERISPPAEEREVKEVEEPELAPEVSPPPVEPAPVDKSLRKVEVAYFYPQDYNKEFEELKAQFDEVLKKHKLKFRLEAVFEKEYMVEKRINYGMFAELCKTAKVRIAIILGPPPESSLSADEFLRMLEAILGDANISLHFIPFRDVKKRYKYLNMLLDIAMVQHKEIFPK